MNIGDRSLVEELHDLHADGTQNHDEDRGKDEEHEWEDDLYGRLHRHLFGMLFSLVPDGRGLDAEHFCE